MPELVGDIRTLLCLSWTGPSKPQSLECPVPHFSDRKTEVHITIVPLPGWQVAWAGPSLSLGSFPLTGSEQFPALMCLSGHCSLYPQVTLQGFWSLARSALGEVYPALLASPCMLQIASSPYVDRKLCPPCCVTWHLGSAPVIVTGLWDHTASVLCDLHVCAVFSVL